MKRAAAEDYGHAGPACVEALLLEQGRDLPEMSSDTLHAAAVPGD
ncbi:MAG: hypothetical protein U5L11_11715 [Arhodomonas sp.]|nr:hypothetical protein [Arhodomonas sp.]